MPITIAAVSSAAKVILPLAKSLYDQIQAHRENSKEIDDLAIRIRLLAGYLSAIANLSLSTSESEEVNLESLAMENLQKQLEEANKRVTEYSKQWKMTQFVLALDTKNYILTLHNKLGNSAEDLQRVCQLRGLKVDEMVLDSLADITSGQQQMDKKIDQNQSDLLKALQKLAALRIGKKRQKVTMNLDGAKGSRVAGILLPAPSGIDINITDIMLQEALNDESGGKLKRLQGLVQMKKDYEQKDDTVDISAKKARRVYAVGVGYISGGLTANDLLQLLSMPIGRKKLQERLSEFGIKSAASSFSSSSSSSSSSSVSSNSSSTFGSSKKSSSSTSKGASSLDPTKALGAGCLT